MYATEIAAFITIGIANVVAGLFVVDSAARDETVWAGFKFVGSVLMAAMGALMLILGVAAL